MVRGMTQAGARNSPRSRPRGTLNGLHRVIKIRGEIFSRMLGLDLKVRFLVVLVLKMDLESAFPFSLDDERTSLGIFDVGPGDGIGCRNTHSMLLYLNKKSRRYIIIGIYILNYRRQGLSMTCLEIWAVFH
jgi:hypothetical protein